ncbi:MAG: universal stress protein [Phycisphaerae bacterium]|nr:universal stress protein [Phycisphaerae bacterium]
MRKPIQRIMVYIDGSEPSITGARYAICLASSCEAELIVCYVVNTTAVEELLRARIFLQDEQVEYEHDMEANAERYLNYVGDLAARKGVAVIREKGRGSVHREIVEAVKRHGADLLVGSPDQSGPHVQALADVARLARSKAFCRAVVAAQNAQEIVDLMQDT